MCDIAGIQSNLIDAGAVHVQVESGQIHHLLHMDVRRTRNLAHLICDLLRNVVIGAHIGTNNLDVNRGGQTEIKNLRDDIGGLEEEFHARKTRWEFAAQPAHVARCWMMMFRIQ